MHHILTSAQENLHARQAPGKGHVSGTRGARPVLGEISQNVTSRRQNLRGGKQVCIYVLRLDLHVQHC